MRALDDIALYFGQLVALSSRAAVYCRDIPVLGGALRNFFVGANDVFRDIRTGFSQASDFIDILDISLSNFLTWDGIRDNITLTWGYLDDIPGLILDRVNDVIRDQYGEITDFWGNVGIGVNDIIRNQYGEITDFWGNVGIGVSDWLTDSLPGWMEDRAEDMVDLAGRILDRVW